MSLYGELATDPLIQPIPAVQHILGDRGVERIIEAGQIPGPQGSPQQKSGKQRYDPEFPACQDLAAYSVTLTVRSGSGTGMRRHADALSLNPARITHQISVSSAAGVE